jgi:glycosyltransferase involved in cell wall biosynthesis
MKLGFFTHHCRTYTGYDNLALSFVKHFSNLKDVELRVQFGSSPILNTRNAFGLEMPPIKSYSRLFDIDTYINMSYYFLQKPLGRNMNIAFLFSPVYYQGLEDYDTIVVPSNFVKSACSLFIKWKNKPKVLVINPGIDIRQFYIAKKRKSILSVGSYFNSRGKNKKRQDVLINAFKKLYKKDKKWTFDIVGYIYDRGYYNELRNMAEGLPIRFYDSIPFELLRKLYAQATVYWQATGYEAKDMCEHEPFGLSVIEAMASGTQPLIYPSGGIAEFENVIKWQNTDELIEQTLSYIPNQKNIAKISSYAATYSLKKTFSKWQKLLQIK